ncbi:eva-1 [Branchiostoma belcheri]|nr:eva-1 [Branchiostoma belcheri]
MVDPGRAEEPESDRQSISAASLRSFHVHGCDGEHVTLRCISAASLRSFHVHGCDGEHVTLRCPHGTTISIQRAMYGRQLPSLEMCPSYARSATLSAAEAAKAAAQKLPIDENTNCDSPTSLQKMLDECQNKRHCQVQVHTQVFGVDPCPGTSKYLEVKYKCKPSQYKGRVACDGDTLRLRCKKNHRLAIYTAMYGRGQDGSLECPSNIPQPHNECRSASALQRIIQQCQGKPRCVLEADSGEYGDPCPRGTRKYVSVIYTCVHVSFSLRKFPNEVRIPIKVRTPGLGLVGDKYSRLKPDLQDVTTASKVCSEERKTSFSGSMFWKAVLSAAHATALSVFFSCRCTLPVGAPNTPPTGRAVVAHQLSQPLGMLCVCRRPQQGRLPFPKGILYIPGRSNFPSPQFGLTLTS